MKKKDIEKLLKAEIEDNVPFVLPEVLNAPIVKEKVKKEPAPKKPYFQFRYLYLSLAMCAVLVIGVGFILPQIKNSAILAPEQSVEEYNITTNITINNYTAKIVSTSNNKVTSIVITNSVENSVKEFDLVENTNFDSALNLVVKSLKDNNAFEGNPSLTLKVTTSNNKYVNKTYDTVKTALNATLTKLGVTVTIK